MEKSKIDLLPCPFCGRKPKSIVNIQMYAIGCSFSKCHVYPCVVKKTPEEAAKAWNTRASGWIPCSERMPDMMADRRPKSGWSDDIKPSDYVLCYTNFKRQIVAWYSHAYDEWTDVEEDHTYSRDEITHWMPLPDNPEAEDKA